MANALMIDVHVSAAWTMALAARDVRRIPAAARARRLTVNAGHVWITTQGDAGHDGEDLWLGAGDAVALAAGAEAWVEGRDAASLSVADERTAARGMRALATDWRRAVQRVIAHERTARQWGAVDAARAD